MTIMWDKIKRNLIESLNIAIDKTEEMTSVGRIKLEMLQLEHRLDEKFAELGKHVHNQLLMNPEHFSIDEQIVTMRKDIEELAAQLRKKEKELGRIKEENGIDLDAY